MRAGSPKVTLKSRKGLNLFKKSTFKSPLRKRENKKRLSERVELCFGWEGSPTKIDYRKVVGREIQKMRAGFPCLFPPKGIKSLDCLRRCLFEDDGLVKT